MMPRFYFDLVDNGELLRDETGVSLESIGAAKAEARKALGDLVREEIRDGTTHRDITIHIRDHGTGPVKLSVTYSVIDSDE